ncbi:glycoside hydrolase family 35 protein [Vagococcus silagei]|uniref:Beta-galactosidase n=1 Tax=Vagococcus silagei TaxID=2508885 RepID=A0A4S3B4M2_9ENTE|nr:beta-galactosidase family protein [Vagococcus silagei]THB60750.1 beta-galactosidase [Vagococcus silagei]
MKVFEIKEDFILAGQPLKIISGAIHYFRMTPRQWEDSLYNLKALGANTVETYIPWNIHEPEEGVFDFEGLKNIELFVKKAQELGLMVILRPSVYICAEWEFGGLPAWILHERGIRLRSTDPVFMQKVDNYFKVLIPKLAPLQITHGGPVIMMQIENEYGSYGMEKDYLRQTQKLMEKYGIDVPLFTSDGSWPEVLDAGTLIDDDIFVTGNFGSRSKENGQVMREFMEKHNKKWPIMCMEYWDGWFNRWGEPIIKRDAQDLADEVKDMLEIGSLNLYMFHGGTNFGFYNGCSARETMDLPQVTSYDYDALLNESGEPTEKYYAVQKAIKEVCPMAWQSEPRLKQNIALGTYPVTDSVSLFNTKEALVDEPIYSPYPLTMEKASNGYGYMLYSMTLPYYGHENKFKVVEASDRIQIFTDGNWQTTQYQETNGKELMIAGQENTDTINVDILIENMGRVNYGFKLNNPTQMKGIRNGVMQDIHFHQGYYHYPVTLTPEELARVDYSAGKNSAQPSFYQVEFELEQIGDTFIDCSNYGKGAVVVNGVNIGRYWNQGPHLSLYCPQDFLNIGKNTVVIFETEGVEISEVSFCDKPKYLA